MIDFEHVSKEYKKGGRLALEDINFHVDEGEFVFLLGHSGAGKSTLLKLILREALPTSGKVTVLGKDVAKLRRHKIPYLRRQMGITVLVVTHEHELVHRFHQRVVTLSHGRIISDVPADPVAAAEDDLSLDVAAFDADDASAAKKEVAAV